MDIELCVNSEIWDPVLTIFHTIHLLNISTAWRLDAMQNVNVTYIPKFPQAISKAVTCIITFDVQKELGTILIVQTSGLCFRTGPHFELVWLI